MNNKFSIDEIEDKYLILKELSYGGQASVFLVKKKGTDEEMKFAAKISKENDPSFDEEIEILNTLKTQNCKYITNIENSGTGDIIWKGKYKENKNYIILELASKRDLGEYIRFTKQGLEESHSKVIFYKILKGIQSIHKSKICHRDIKLDNILFDEKFNPKIGDFGHAIEYIPNLEGICGTKEYRAPEIRSNKSYDGYLIDIFSLGISLIELVSGSYGFYTSKIKGKRLYYQCVINGEKESFWKLLETNSHKEFSEEFKNLCFDMISKDPQKRPKIGEILKK